MANQIKGQNAITIKSIKINKIDASGAVKELQSQLEHMLSGLQITGIKDFLGKSTPESLAKAKAVITNLTGELKSLNEISSSVTNKFKGAIAGRAPIEDPKELDMVIQRYAAWQNQIEQLKSLKNGMTRESIASLAQEGVAIRDQILHVQKLQATAKAEASSTIAANKMKIASTQALSNFTKQISEYMLRNPKVAARFGDELTAIIQRLRSGASITAAELSTLRGRFAEVRTESALMGLQGKTALEAIGDAYKKFGGWTLITRSTISAIRIMKQMVTAVKEIDHAMTDLRIITSETAFTYIQFGRDAARAAKEIGSSVTSLLQSSTTWARLGYSLDESLDLAKISTIFSNVAGLDINAATTSLVSSLKAFNFEAGNAIDLVDKLTYVGNNFAIDAAGIGEGLQNSAAALVAAGNDIDQSIALITAGNLVTQDPSKVGNALKTTALRIRGAKAELEEMGEEVDDLVEGTSKLRGQILALSGVDIMLDDTTFKSTYQILKEIAVIWDQLSDVSQAAILEDLAGKRNANVVASILQNFGEAEATLQASLESSGAAMEANEIRLDSIVGKMEQFKAAFEEISNTVINSKFLMVLLDGGTSLLTILNSIIEKLGALPTLLTAAAAVMSSNSIHSKLTPFQIDASGASFGFSASMHSDIRALKAYNAELSKGVAAKVAFEKTMQNASASTVQFANSYKGAAVPVGTLTQKLIGQRAAALAAATAQAALNAAWTLGVSLLITGLITGISKLINAQKEARAAAKEAAAAAAAQSQEIAELAIKYMELSEAVKKDASVKTAFMAVQSQLLKMLNSERQTISGLTEEYGDLDTAISHITLQALQNELRDLTGGLNVAKQELLDTTAEKFFSSPSLISVGGDGYNIHTMNMLAEKGFIKTSSYGSAGGTISLHNFDLNDVDGIIAARDHLGLILDAIKEELGVDLAAVDAAYIGVYEVYEQISKAAVAYDNANRAINENLANTLIIKSLEGLQLPKSQAEFDTLKDSIIESAYASGEFVGAIEDVENSVLHALAGFPQFSEFLVISAEDMAGVAGYTANLSDLSSTLSELKSAYEIVSEAEKDMLQSGSLSAETITKLMSATDNYLDYLYEENGQIKLNIQAWQELSDAKMNQDLRGIENETAALREQYQEQMRLLEEYKRRRDESANRSERDHYSMQIAAVTDEIEKLDARIVENQAKLRMYNSIFASIRPPDLSKAANGMEAFAAAQSRMEAVVNTVRSYSDAMSTLADIQQAVSKGFVISTEKAMEFAAVYPEILNGAQKTSDGQMQLQQDVVEAFLQNKRAELNAAIDTEITKLKAEKLMLTAKKDSAEAQLDIAKQVASGEIDLENAKNQLLSSGSETLLEYLKQRGLDELSADKAVKAAEAGNMEEYRDIVGKYADDISTDLANSIAQASTATFRNVVDMVSYYDSLGRQIARVAGQIGNLDDGTVSYDGPVSVNGRRPKKSGFEASGNVYSFEGVDPKDVDASGKAVLKWIENIELDISGYTKAIAQISGQIAALEALKNIPLSKFASKSGRSKKEIEEYIAKINELYLAEERLTDIQERRGHLEIRQKLTDSAAEQLKIMREILGTYEQEQQALHSINQLRRDTIDKNIVTLQAQGFEISYDRDHNKLLVHNMERINELTGANAEATNELREEVESLLQSTIELNDANKANSKSWLNLEESKRTARMEMAQLRLGVYDEFIRHADSFDLWDHLDISRVDYLKKQLAEIHQLYEEGLIPSAEEYKKQVDAVAVEIYREQKSALEDIIDLTMKLIKQEKQDQMDALREQIAAYEKIIQLKKLSLEQTKKDDDYQKEVAKKLKAIAELQSRIDQLALDDSREAAAQRSKLEEELAKLQEELADYQADYAYNAQQDALDKELDKYKDTKDKEIKEVESTVDTTAKLYALAIDRINNQWDTLYEQLYDWNEVYGDGIAGRDSIASKWDLAREALERYGSVQSAIMGVKTENNSPSLPDSGNSTGVSAEVNYLVNKMIHNSLKWPSASDARRLELEAENERHAIQIERLIGQKVVKHNGTWYIGSESGKLLYDAKFHDGGVVGQEGIKDREILALLEKGEVVLNEPKKETAYKLIDFGSYILERFGKIGDIPDLQSVSKQLVSPSLTIGDSNGGNINLETTVNVYVEKLDQDEAHTIGKSVAETALDHIAQGFAKRGVSSFRAGTLKPV